jgi:hypothetical protein
MGDESAPTTFESAVDPVAEARRRMAAQESGGGDIDRLKGQVRALWITMGVTILVVVVLAGFTLLPRLFGVRMFGDDGQGRPPGVGRGFGQQGADDQTPAQP